MKNRFFCGVTYAASIWARLGLDKYEDIFLLVGVGVAGAESTNINMEARDET